MHPTICQIGPFTVYSYGLMLVLAFLVAMALAKKQALRENVDPELVFNFGFMAFIFGIIGARLFFIVENLRYYIEYPLEMIMLQRGGLSWFGGFFLGAFAAFIYLKRKKISVYLMLDLLAPFIALAQALGRIGCLLNGCCYGKVSAHGIYFAAHDAILVPTQLYSSLLLIVIFIILRKLQDSPHAQGSVFFAYLLLYSLKRFFIEFLRVDNPVIFFGLTLFQLISVSVFFFALIKLIRIKR